MTYCTLPYLHCHTLYIGCIWNLGCVRLHPLIPSPSPPNSGEKGDIATSMFSLLEFGEGVRGWGKNFAPTSECTLYMRILKRP
jgi:hypothetical protein